MTLIFVGAVALNVTITAISQDQPRTGESERTLQQNRERFYAQIRTLRWLAYTPSTFDPDDRSGVAADDIEKDLATLARYIDPRTTGICTYGCDPARGLDQIGPIVHRLGFAGHVLGVWTIDPEGDEFQAAVKLATSGHCTAVCVGNEGLGVRYSLAELRNAINAMRKATMLPVSTSEQITDYGTAELRDPQVFDYVFPNIHPVYNGHHRDPLRAAEYVTRIAKELRSKVAVPCLVRETGWPTQGLRTHTSENQRLFWQIVLAEAERSHLSIVIFECFDQPWKRERFRGVNIGPAWGWFTADRAPKLVVDVIRRDQR